MIVEERIVSYLHSLEGGLSAGLETVEREALAGGVPIIRKEMQSFLRVLVAIRKPMRILEIGTAVGFSALLMWEAAPEGCRIDTIECEKKRCVKARANFEAAGAAGQIALLEGEAKEILPGLEGPYDLIFVDGAKGQYTAYLPEVLRLLGEGGVLLSDNVLQDGEVAQSRFAVERRDRTVHRRMREYLYILKHHPLLETAVLPLGDGAALSVKRGGTEHE